jgi:branched-chain amino acid transport system substrate-binding protein
MELVASEPFEASALDITPQLLNLKQAECDAIIVWTMYQQGALIATQARQQGIDVPLVGGGGLTNARIYTLGGEAVLGLVNSQTFFAGNPYATQFQKDFISAFEAKHGRLPDSNNAMSYDAMMVMADGLRAAGPELRNTDIMAGILAVADKDLATGKITIAPNGDAVRDEILMVRLIGYRQYELVSW